jgi:hypothetical protein
MRLQEEEDKIVPDLCKRILKIRLIGVIGPINTI